MLNDWWVVISDSARSSIYIFLLHNTKRKKLKIIIDICHVANVVTTCAWQRCFKSSDIGPHVVWNTIFWGISTKHSGPVLLIQSPGQEKSPALMAKNVKEQNLLVVLGASASDNYGMFSILCYWFNELLISFWCGRISGEFDLSRSDTCRIRSNKLWYLGLICMFSSPVRLFWCYE